MPLPAALRALRGRTYRLFISGQLVSLIGTWMQTVAQSWLVYRMTGSPAMLGLIGFAGQIPVFVLAPLGGVFADRLNRHGILVITQTTMMILALTLAALTLMGVVRIWQIFVLASLLGVANAFDIPARQAFIVQMVGREDLVNAIALNSSMVNGARMVGPAVAGIVVAEVGEGWCFLLNGLSYVAVITALLRMRIVASASSPAMVSAWDSVVEGFSFAWQTRPVRALLLLLGLVSLMGMPYTVLMPIFADRILGGGPHAYGLLMSCSGVGALLGAASLTFAAVGQRSGPLGGILGDRFRRRPDCVLVFAILVAVGADARARRVLHDGGDGGVEYVDPIDGSGSPARPCHGGLLDDVHGHGAARRTHGRRAGSATGRPGDGRNRRSRVHRRRSRLRFTASRASRPSTRADRRATDGGGKSARRGDEADVVTRLPDWASACLS